MSTAHQMPGGKELTAQLLTSEDARNPINTLNLLSNIEGTGAESTRHSELLESSSQFLVALMDLEENLKRLTAQYRQELARLSKCGSEASGCCSRCKASLALGQASCQGASQSGATQNSGQLDAHGAAPPQACGGSGGAIAVDVGVQSQHGPLEGGEPVRPIGEVDGSGLPPPTSPTSDRNDELQYQVADFAPVETEEEDGSEDLPRREGASGQHQRETPLSHSRQPAPLTTNGQAEEGHISTAGSQLQVGTSVWPE